MPTIPPQEADDDEEDDEVDPEAPTVKEWMCDSISEDDAPCVTSEGAAVAYHEGVQWASRQEEPHRHGRPPTHIIEGSSSGQETVAESHFTLKETYRKDTEAELGNYLNRFEFHPRAPGLGGEVLQGSEPLSALER